MENRKLFFGDFFFINLSAWPYFRICPILWHINNLLREWAAKLKFTFLSSNKLILLWWHWTMVTFHSSDNDIFHGTLNLTSLFCSIGPGKIVCTGYWPSILIIASIVIVLTLNKRSPKVLQATHYLKKIQHRLMKL